MARYFKHDLNFMGHRKIFFAISLFLVVLSIGALGYANRLYVIIVGLFSFVATNLLFPVFARAAASGDSEEGGRLMRVSLKTLVFLIAPISAGVAVLAVPFVGLIYENGAFTPSDTLLTAEALSMYAVGMLFNACAEVLTKAFFASELTRLPMISSLAAICFNIAALYGAKALLGERFGVGAIALVTALAAGVNMTVNLVFALKKGLLSPTAGDLCDLGKSVLSALAMGAAVWAVWNRAGSLGLGRIAGFGLAVLCGMAVYAVCAVLLRSETILALRAKRKPPDSDSEGAAT